MRGISRVTMKILYLLLLISPVFFQSLFLFYAVKRGWRSIRLLSASTTVCFAIFSLILWYGTGEIWILKMSLGFTLYFGISILFWPIIAKELVKKIGLRW